MGRIIYILTSLLLVLGLYFTGVLAGGNLTHPVWYKNAVLYGSLGGAVVSAGLFWACTAKPRLGRSLERVVMLGLLAAVCFTLFNARSFIASEVFDPVAIGRWHIGSYAVFALLVPSMAALLVKLRIIGKGGRG